MSGLLHPVRASKLKKRTPSSRTAKEKRASQQVSCQFAGNEFSGLVKTSSLGVRSFEGADNRYKWSSGVRYEGPFVSSKAQGVGKFFWPDGSHYTGDVVDGRRHGHGVYVAVDGITRYEGQWRDGKRHGRGRLMYDEESLSYYDGDWEDGLKHGDGHQVWPSKNSYVGQWKCGKMSGHGSMTWVDSGVTETYTGHWEDGHPQGEGVQTWHAPESSSMRTSRPGSSGSSLPSQQMLNQYRGEWRDGVRHGKGIFCYANGARYEGEWDGNTKHGHGRYTYEDGRVYNGEFTGDQMTEFGVPDSKPLSKAAPHIGAEDNPVRQCMDVSDLEAFCLPVDAGPLDLTVGSGYDEPCEVFREVFNLLLRNVGQLKKIYSEYRTLLHRPGEDPFVLQAHQLWVLAGNLGLITPGCPLSRLNRFLFTGPRHQQETCFDDMEYVKPLEPDFEGEPLTPREPTPIPVEPLEGPFDDEGNENNDEEDDGRSAYDNSGSTSVVSGSAVSEFSKLDERSRISMASEGSSPNSTSSKSGRPLLQRSASTRSSVGAMQPRMSSSSTNSVKLAPETVPEATATEADEGCVGHEVTLQPTEAENAGAGSEEGRPREDPHSKFWRREGEDPLADVHAPDTGVMFRHFLEGLVRMSLAHFTQEKGLERQVKRLFQERLLPDGEIGVSPNEMSAAAQAFGFLVDQSIQGTLRAFEQRLREVFRANACGTGAYATPEWAAGTPTPARRRKRHFGGQERRSHIGARLDVTVRVKDVLQLLKRAGFLRPLDADEAVGAGADGDDPTNWQPEGPLFAPQDDEVLEDSASAVAKARTPEDLGESPGASPKGDQQVLPEHSPQLIAHLSPPVITINAEEGSQPSESQAKPEEVLQCDFTISFLQVLRIVCELAAPESLEQMHWALGSSVSPSAERLCLLDFVETELTFAEFCRVLLRLAQRQTDKFHFDGKMPLHRSLEGFLEHVFFPSLQTPYVPPTQSVEEQPSVDSAPAPEEPAPPYAFQVSGAGLPDVDGVYRRLAAPEKRPDGGFILFAQESELYGIVLYPAAAKEGPAWAIHQRATNGKRAYILRLKEDPGSMEIARVPASEWEVFEVPKDKASLPGKSPAPTVDPYEDPPEESEADAEYFWAGFDDEEGLDFAFNSVPRTWPDGYEDEVSAW